MPLLAKKGSPLFNAESIKKRKGDTRRGIFGEILGSPLIGLKMATFSKFP